MPLNPVIMSCWDIVVQLVSLYKLYKGYFYHQNQACNLFIRYFNS